MNLENTSLSIIKCHYRAVVICFVLLTIACTAIADFRVEHSIESWVDKDSDNYLRYRRMLETYGDDATLLIVYQRKELAQTRLDDYQAFIEHIRASKGVSSVYDPVSLFLLSADGDSLDTGIIDDLEHAFMQRPADFRNVLMSPDLDTLCILVILKQDLEYLHPQIIKRIKQGMSNIGLHAHFAGTSYFSTSLAESLSHDLRIIISGLLISTFLILLWFLRDPIAVICIITGIAISLICTIALTTLMGIEFNLLHLILYPLVFCIGLTTSIHLFSRRIRGVWDLASAFKKIFRPTIITMITTVIGCGAFIFAPQTVVREMGMAFPVAVGITYFVMLIFVPSAWQLLASKRELPRLPVSTTVKSVSGKNTVISLLLFGIALLAVLKLPGLKTEPDAMYFFAHDSELIQSYKYIEARLAGLMVVDMIVETSDARPITSAENTASIAQFLRAARALPGLTTIVSPLDWLHSFTADTISPELKNAYLSKNRTSMRITLRFRSLSDVPYRSSISALNKLWNENTHAGLTMHISGLLPLILAAQDALLITQAIVFPFILILMTLVLALIIPAFRVVLCACVANLLPLIIMAGAMAVLAIPVNSINLFVVSVMLGVIVDDTIHLLYAWHRSGRIDAAMQEVGPALWITSLTITVAFANLLFSSLRPIAEFGVLSAIAVISAYLCDVYLLPWLLDRGQLRA